jgi:integrase
MSQKLTNYDNSPLAQAGQVANAYASQNVFREYQERRAYNTLRRQQDDLKLFSRYLADAGVEVSATDLYTSVETWRYITHGLIDGFKRWMLQHCYAVGSVNVRLATIKKYAALATMAGVMDATEYALVKMVQGYTHKEGRNLDIMRGVSRTGQKKGESVPISKEQAAALKAQPDTPQGKRDALLVCLLLDHGLRCGEIAALMVSSINLSAGTLTFYREKVDKVQIHDLTRDTLLAATRYIEACKPVGRLIMGSYKGGRMHGAMGTRAITARARILGERVGLVSLSAHDGRHYWATAAIRGGTDIKSLQDAGGWNSPMMALRYAESNKVANKGVTLG